MVPFEKPNIPSFYHSKFPKRLQFTKPKGISKDRFWIRVIFWYFTIPLTCNSHKPIFHKKISEKQLWWLLWNTKQDRIQRWTYQWWVCPQCWRHHWGHLRRCWQREFHLSHCLQANYVPIKNSLLAFNSIDPN